MRRATDVREVDRGFPVPVIVRGKSGMGKTALGRAFLHDLQHRDSNVVLFSGRSYEQESVPYKAVDSLIDDLARYLRRASALEAKALLPTDAAALARLFPVLQELDVLTKARRKLDIVDSQELRRRAFAALRELLARMSDERRVVLFLDDVQWGDRDSAALLADVLRPPDAPPLLVIAAHRTEEAELSPMLGELAKIRDATAGTGWRDSQKATAPPISKRTARPATSGPLLLAAG
jgi:predicted ATPase